MLGRRFDPKTVTARRAHLDMSIKTLAERAGLSYRNVRRIELGERPKPYATTLVKLAAALGCTVDDLTVPDTARNVAA